MYVAGSQLRVLKRMSMAVSSLSSTSKGSSEPHGFERATAACMQMGVSLLCMHLMSAALSMW